MDWHDFFFRRIYEARIGYSIYLAYLVTMSTAVIVWYTFVVESIPTLKWIFPNLYVFGAFFVVVSILGAILLGHYVYVGNQLRIEQTLISSKNPYLVGAMENSEKIFKLLDERLPKK